MLLIAIAIIAVPLERPLIVSGLALADTAYTNKRKKAAARKAGYTHMRRGKAGYSANLDRDGDGVACDKAK